MAFPLAVLPLPLETERETRAAYRRAEPGILAHCAPGEQPRGGDRIGRVSADVAALSRQKSFEKEPPKTGPAIRLQFFLLPCFPLAMLTLKERNRFAIQFRGHFALEREDIMQVNKSKKEKHTRGFKEALYTIEFQGKALAVLGANSQDHALLRAEVIRNQVPLPRHELLQAKFLPSGPICVPYFAGSYFLWLSSFDDLESSTCPICGR